MWAYPQCRLTRFDHEVDDGRKRSEKADSIIMIGMEHIRDRSRLVGFGALLAVICLVLYGSPRDGVYPEHDFLDGSFVVYSLRAGHPDSFFTVNPVTPKALNGFPLNASGLSDLNFFHIAYLILDPYLAFSLNSLVLRFLSFGGMYLFLNWYLTMLDFRDSHRDLVASCVSFFFSLLPYWEPQSATIGLQPLLLWAVFTRICRRKSAATFLVIALFPFLTSLVYGGFAIVGFGVAAGLARAVGRKADARPLFIWSGYLLAAYAIANWRLFHLLYLTDFIPHRGEFGDFRRPFFSTFVENVMHGQYHNASGQWPVILALPAVLAVFESRGRLSGRKAPSPCSPFRHLLFLILAIISISIFHALEWAYLLNVGDLIGISSFSFARVVCFHPILWGMVAAVSISCLFRMSWSRLPRVAAALAIIALTAQGINDAHGLRRRARNILADAGLFGERPFKYTTMSEYYREPVFSRIRTAIGRDLSEFRVVSVGFEPMIALYNGFYILDGYFNLYDLRYKKVFRDVIAPHLLRNPHHRKLFDEHASRIHVWSDQGNGASHTLDIDTVAFWKMGGRVVLSSVTLANSTELGFTKIAEIDDIRVYSLGFDLAPESDDSSVRPAFR